MKSSVMVLVVFFCIAGHVCLGQSDNIDTAGFRKLEWLIGMWERTNSKPGRAGHERWVRISDTLIQGYGVTMGGSDTLFLEDIKLIVKEDAIFYVADVKENPNPIYFKLTQLTDDGFVCENPAHDFPKKIVYKREGDLLTAITSANDKSIEFHFVRKLSR